MRRGGERWRRRSSVFGRPACLLASIFGLAAAMPAPAKAVDYLTIEPNEGQAAGGHSALRFGDLVYHFEHQRDGLLVLRRDPRGEFDAHYRARGNRTLHVWPLALADDESDRLRRRLDARYEREQRWLRRLEGLREDAELLSAWYATSAEGVELPRALRAVPGLGLLEPGPSSCDEKEALARRRRLASAHGVDLEAERAHHRAAWSDLARDARFSGAAAQPVGLAEHPRDYLPLSRRHHDALAAWAALEAIDHCRALRSTYVRVVDPAWLPFDDATRERIAALRAAAETRLVGLLRSRRSDRGRALLLAHARLQALDRSLEHGALHVLDSYAEDSRSLPPDDTGLSRDQLAGLAVAEADGLRRALVASEADAPSFELDLRRIERRGNRLAELVGALSSDRPLRVARALPLPSVSAPAADPGLPPGLTRESIERALDSTQQAIASSERLLAEEHGYRLFRHNCATELRTEIDAALWRGPMPSDWRDPLVFVPSLADDVVIDRVGAGPRIDEPGHRMQVLSQRGGRDSPWRSLMEATTVGSSVYTPRPADSVFLFFTEGPVWARPILGAANIVWALGHAVVGLVGAPFDDGRLLARSGRGVAMSVPELVFFNVRKGSFVAVPAESAEPTGSR